MNWAGAQSTFVNAANNYTGAFRNLTPPCTHQADAQQLNTITGLGGPQASTIIPFTLEHTRIQGELVADTMVIGDMAECMNLMALHPNMHADVMRNVTRLVGVGLTNAQMTVASMVIAEVTVARNRLATAVAGPVNATAYKQQTSPRAQMFQTIVRGIQNGMAIVEDATVLFDPVAGKPVVPFPKATKVSSPARLMYAVSSFCTFMTIAAKEAPTVYYQFQTEIMRVCDAHGHLMGQQMADTILRKIDDQTYANMVALFAAGENNRLLAELLASQAALRPVQDGKQQDGNQQGGARVDPRNKFSFGPVTQPMGGQGAGLIDNHKTGAKVKCNRFHAVPQLKCTAGVPSGHSSGMAGLCAYSH